jgi:hypothetical protein
MRGPQHECDHETGMSTTTLGFIGLGVMGESIQKG